MLTMYVQAAEMVVAAGFGDNFGKSLAKTILAIIGTFFLLFVVAKLIKAFAEEKWGKAASILGFAVLVAGFIYVPDTSIGILTDIWKLFTAS